MSDVSDAELEAELEAAGIDKAKCEFVTSVVMRALINGCTPGEAVAILFSCIANIATQQSPSFAQLEDVLLPGLLNDLADTIHTAWNNGVEAGRIRPEDNTGNPFQAPYVPPHQREHAPGRA